MQKIILLSLSILLVGCSSSSHNEGTFSRALPKAEQNLTHKAYHYYGLHEQKDRKLIQELTGVDPVTTEWCAAFVNMVLLEQGLPTSEFVSDYPLMARSFLIWGEEITTPKQGDIVIFERGETGWQGHVGFYVSSFKNGEGKEYMNILGGNQKDQVTIDAYPVSRLLGIRRLSI